MELSLNDLRDLLAPTPPSTPSALHKFVGKAVFVRTVTHHHTGRLYSFDADWLVLDDAAWIADDGRFADALAKGTLNEVEPFPDGTVLVSRGSVIDLCEWRHPLPRTQK